MTDCEPVMISNASPVARLFQNLVMFLLQTMQMMNLYWAANLHQTATNGYPERGRLMEDQLY